MKLLVAFAALGFIAVMTPRVSGPASAEAQAVQVKIDGYAFKSPSITISTGTLVTWNNLDDDPHTVTATDGSFDSSGLAQGDTFSHKFIKPGTYQYYCKVHPMMRGSVTVKEAGT